MWASNNVSVKRNKICDTQKTGNIQKMKKKNDFVVIAFPVNENENIY